MCIFQTLKFENYTSEPRIKPTYYLAGEEPKAYRSRQRERQASEAADNVARNATGTPLPRQAEHGLLKVAETDEKPRYIAHSSSEFYTPRYGDWLIKFERGYYRMLLFKSGVHGDHWELYGWSDREEFIHERIEEQGMKKVGEWGMSDEPEVVGYYREEQYS